MDLQAFFTDEDRDDSSLSEASQGTIDNYHESACDEFPNDTSPAKRRHTLKSPTLSSMEATLNVTTTTSQMTNDDSMCRARASTPTEGDGGPISGVIDRGNRRPSTSSPQMFHTRMMSVGRKEEENHDEGGKASFRKVDTSRDKTNHSDQDAEILMYFWRQQTREHQERQRTDEFVRRRSIGVDELLQLLADQTPLRDTCMTTGKSSSDADRCQQQEDQWSKQSARSDNEESQSVRSNATSRRGRRSAPNSSFEQRLLETIREMIPQLMMENEQDQVRHQPVSTSNASVTQAMSAPVVIPRLHSCD